MTRKCRLWTGAALGALALALAPCASIAETAAPAPAADVRADAQKSAFLAMPEADRKATQDALGWLGLYNGAVDGAWGKRTRDSILAFQGSQAAPQDGIVSASQLASLKGAAHKARAAVGFEIVDERRSGVRLGAPLDLLTKIVMVGSGAALQSADGAVTLTAQARPGDQPALAALYAKTIVETNGRKVTYKAIKADDFFVVATEEGERKSYVRFAKSPPDWADGPSLRGFIFSYPKDQAGELDRISVAIANSFEPFSSSPTSLDTSPARASSAALTWRDIVKPAPASEPAVSTAPSPPAQTAPPPPTETLATGLIVAPGQALTAVGECANPTVDGKPARTLRADAATGLALLGGDFAPAGAPPSPGAASADLVTLSFSDLDPGKPALQASAATLAPGDGPQQILAALAKSASGAPVFDRNGALAALVGPIHSEPGRIAGVPLAEPHGVIASEAIARFLGSLASAAPAQASPLGAGDIAREKRAAVVRVVCRS